MPAGKRRKYAGGSEHRRRHHDRRRKGQANRDPARKYGMVPGGGPQRHPSGSKLFVGIVGPQAGTIRAMGGKDSSYPWPERTGRTGAQKRRARRRRGRADTKPAERGHAHLGRAG